MSFSLILGAFWIIAASIVATLPMRQQFPPGILLLIAAPILIVWIGFEYGWLWLAFGTFAFLSMFRRPLLYIGGRTLHRLRGLSDEELS